MRILNFGSMNLDYVYRVDHIVAPGETILSDRLDVHSGGKGLNQSIALARAGAKVSHAGMIGADGDMLLEACAADGVDATLVKRVAERTGNAIIQVAADGQNSIVLFGGANRKNDRHHVDQALAGFAEGDILLLQNEINLMDYIIDRAWQKGLRIALNPSPYDAGLAACDLSKIWMLLFNEVEGAQIAGCSEPQAILDSLAKKLPNAVLVLTLGEKGVVCRTGGASVACPAFETKVVDTTAAGDTFTGYFLTAVSEGMPTEEGLKLASMAASIAVSRAGAAPSIPRREEVAAKLAGGLRG